MSLRLSIDRSWSNADVAIYSFGYCQSPSSFTSPPANGYALNAVDLLPDASAVEPVPVRPWCRGNSPPIMDRRSPETFSNLAKKHVHLPTEAKNRIRVDTSFYMSSPFVSTCISIETCVLGRLPLNLFARSIRHGRRQVSQRVRCQHPSQV